MGKKSRRGRGCSPLLSLSGRRGILRTRRSRWADGAVFAPKCCPFPQPSPSDDVKIRITRLHVRTCRGLASSLLLMGVKLELLMDRGRGDVVQARTSAPTQDESVLELFRRRPVAIRRRESGILIAKNIHRHYSSGLIKAILIAGAVKG